MQVVSRDKYCNFFSHILLLVHFKMSMETLSFSFSCRIAHWNQCTSRFHIGSNESINLVLKGFWKSYEIGATLLEVTCLKVITSLCILCCISIKLVPPIPIPPSPATPPSPPRLKGVSLTFAVGRGVGVWQRNTYLLTMHRWLFFFSFFRSYSQRLISILPCTCTPRETFNACFLFFF